MPSPLVDIAVKVGKTSKAKFRDAKAYRAITVDELIKLCKNHPSISIVVIENIKQSEYDKARDFVNNFASSGKAVFFYVEDNDDDTCGLADELSYDIYLDIKDLYKAINVTCGVAVDTDRNVIAAQKESTQFENGEAHADLRKSDDPFDLGLGMDEFDHDNTGFGIDNDTELDPEFNKALGDKAKAVADGIDKQPVQLKSGLGKPPLRPGVRRVEVSENQIVIDKAKLERLKATPPGREVVDGNGDNGAVGNVDEAEVGSVGGIPSVDASSEVAETNTFDNISQPSNFIDTPISSSTELPVEEVNTPEQNEQTPAEQTPAEQTPAEQTPAEQTPAEQTPAEQTTIELPIEVVETPKVEQSASNESLTEKTIIPSNSPDLGFYTVDISNIKAEDISTLSFEELQKKCNEYHLRAEALLKVIEAIKTERDIFQKKIKSFGENMVLEEPISLSDYKALQEEVAQLSSGVSKASNAGNEELESRLNEEIESSNRLREELLEIKNKLTTLGIPSTSDNYLEQVDLALSSLDSVNNDRAYEIDVINDRLSREVAGRNFLRTVIEASLAEISQLNQMLIADESDKANLQQSVTELQQVKFDNEQYIADLNNQIESLRSAGMQLEQLQGEVAQLYATINANDQTINGLNATIYEKQELINTLQGQVAEVDKRIELSQNFAKEQIDKFQREAIEWKSKFDMMQAQFKQKENQYNILIQSTGMSEGGVTSLLENSKTIEEINKSLRDQIAILKTDLERAQNDRAFALQQASRSEETAKNLRISMKAMSTGLNGGLSGVSSGITPINYAGRGIILPVFGCGSYGVTTTAMSIAMRLAIQSRVLYIDFDLVAPKADGWLKVNPIIKNLPDADPKSMKSSGLGLLVDKGVQYFLTNAPSIMLKTSTPAKTGCLDYISGFYSKPDPIKLASTDFTSFLNFCGNSYAYIVIDFGRLGSSDLNDQLIKAFADIAYRNIVVTTGDKFEVRTFRMRLVEAKIDIMNVAWLVNMCERTSIEDTAKKAIQPAPYRILTIDHDIMGKRVDFNKSGLLRARIGEFLDKAVFSR